MRFANALFYSFLFSLYGGCFYFAFGLLNALATGHDTTSFIGDFFAGMLVCFVFLAFVFYELIGMFEELNKPRSKDKDPDNDDSDRCDGSEQGK